MPKKKIKRKATKKAKPRKVAKRKVAKKTVKKTVVRAPRLPEVKTPMSKTQILTTLAEVSGIKKKEAGVLFEALVALVGKHLKSKSAGEFTLPGLLKIRVVRKPATKAREGINPFTGELTMFKAKPARNVVKIKSLKKLKDMV